MSFWILLQAANCWLGERLELGEPSSLVTCTYALKLIIVLFYVVGALISFGSALFCVVCILFFYKTFARMSLGPVFNNGCLFT
jgi:hypothetical protein